MSLPEKSFQELLLRLDHGRRLDNTGDDPVYYLVFKPSEMQDIKKRLESWLVKLTHKGWTPAVLSMAEAIEDILTQHDLRDIWLEAEQDSPMDFETINQTLAEALMENDALLDKIREALAEAAKTTRGLLFITDVEALHPYMRIGSLEQRLTGRVPVPAVVLYPGVRTGKYNLKFLGIYPEDGNYRSVHIGG